MRTSQLCVYCTHKPKIQDFIVLFKQTDGTIFPTGLLAEWNELVHLKGFCRLGHPL